MQIYAIIPQPLGKTDSPTFAGGTYTAVVTGVTPTAGVHFATKEYVDLALGAFKTFFLSDTGSGVGSLNYAYPHETGEPQSTIVNDGFGEEYGAGTHLHQGFITEAGEPATTTIHAGVIAIHLHAKKGASNQRITTLRAIISSVDADGTTGKTTLATSEVTAELTDTETDYTIHAVMGSDVEIASTARLICDVYANVTTGAQDTVVTLYMEGTEDSYFTTKVDSGIWQNHDDALDAITLDGSNNMTFTDDVVGTKTLKQLGSPTYTYIKAETQSEGDLHLSDGTNWAVSKAMISIIRVFTSSTDWDLYILQNDNGFAANDANIPMFKIMADGEGNANIRVSYPYEDEDASNEVHLYYIDNSGTNTADIYIIGYEMV